MVAVFQCASIVGVLAFFWELPEGKGSDIFWVGEEVAGRVLGGRGEGWGGGRRKGEVGGGGGRGRHRGGGGFSCQGFSCLSVCKVAFSPHRLNNVTTMRE